MKPIKVIASYTEYTLSGISFGSALKHAFDVKDWIEDNRTEQDTHPFDLDLESPSDAAPLQKHADADSFFLVLDGEITFHIEGHDLVRKRGESAIVPKGVAHSYKNRSAHEASVLVSFRPAHTE